MLKKYTTEGVGKQKFVVGNNYKWEMVDNKDIKLQITEYHKLLEELKVKKIELPEQFVAGLLIEKLPDSWSEYKQQLSFNCCLYSLHESGSFSINSPATNCSGSSIFFNF